MAYFKCIAGKPEEEKTVTAGTSAKTVTPTAGKTMSKVTVNPTPTEAKTAIPSQVAQIVTPSSGNYLSKVTVYGDSDLTASNIKKGVTIFDVLGTLETGKAGIDFGEETLSGKALSISVTHSLGAAPSFVFLLPKSQEMPYSTAGYTQCIIADVNKSSRKYALSTIETTEVYITKIRFSAETTSTTANARTITFKAPGYFAPGDYIWIALA